MSLFVTLSHPLAVLLTPPSPAPSPPPVAGCVPGQAGMPDGVLGELLCGTWGPKAPSAVADFVRQRWPLLLAGLVVLVALVVAWRAWRRRVWRLHAARARWLQIIPPVTATPAATVGLWQLLATALPPPSRWTLRPARIVWEVEADPHGMRVGMWLPPGVNPTAVLRLLQRAWPGVRAEQTAPPRVPGGTATTLTVLPTQPDWLPLVDDTTTASSRNWETAPPDEDRLRAVYDGLASAGRTGGGLLQVHISRAPHRRTRILRQAATHPERARKARGASRAVGLLADGLRALILGVLNVVTPGPTTRRNPIGRTDPYLAELARQARAKSNAAPHLLVAIYATGAGPTKAAALAAAADITSGFGLLSAHFARRRLRGGSTVAAQRWVPESRMSVAAVAEAAALAGLPAEPAAYGLPAAASRRRPGNRDVFRAGPASQRPTRAKRTGSPNPGSTDEDPPTAWSIP
ncbi:hypothetical protein [Actinoplanes teichomyceticus]|uniref:Uncharacterized protein n=1 Tax=Actinoplanes teichomyceticus TaxID=1867 RepID=A0A561VSF5_ACTTI|nr:hypothetical protein [Actinoplanes teichomyceticus]TWG14533.1 hypothetical protein FHX34_104833 [Actinoplanes teichomyceticus]GIF16879.1 hypothetical protein Ate01nite_69110 [Actinoplanes teichomyceticus]